MMTSGNSPKYVTRNPYIQLITRVSNSAEKMQREISDLTTLLIARQSTPFNAEQQRRLDEIYNRLDKQELTLVSRLNPSM